MQILGAFHSRKPGATSRSHQRSRSWSKKGSFKSAKRSHSEPSKPAAASTHTSSSKEVEEKSDEFYIHIILADNWPAWQEALKILPAERVKEIEEAARYYLAVQKYVDACEAAGYDDYYDREEKYEEEEEDERYRKPTYEERKTQRMMDADW
jgi:hypothetical protein